MEDPVVRQPSAGTIISHNAHLLLDENENGPSGSNIPSNGYSVEMYGVNLNDHATEEDRPVSDGSSVRSREMDQSPVDDGRNSKESLNEEARYQKELKDRVRKSYADLGMEPEGILLRDDETAAPTDSLEINEELDYGNINAKGVNSNENRIPDDDERYPEQYEETSAGQNEKLSEEAPGNSGVETNFVEDPERQHDSFPEVTEQEQTVKQIAANEYANTGPYANEVKEPGDEYANNGSYANEFIDPSDEYEDTQSYANEVKNPGNVYAETEPYANGVSKPRNEYAETEPYANEASNPGNEYADNETNGNKILDDEYGYSQLYANEAEDAAVLPDNRHSERKFEDDEPYENVNRISASVNRLSMQSRVVDEEDVPEPRLRIKENYPQVDESFRDSLEEDDHSREVTVGQADRAAIGFRRDAQGGNTQEPLRDSLDEDGGDFEPGVENYHQAQEQQRTHAKMDVDDAEAGQRFQSGGNDILQERNSKPFHEQEETIDDRNSNNNAGVSPPPAKPLEGTERSYANVVQNYPPSNGLHRDIENAAFNERRTPPLPPAMPPEPPPPILSGQPASARRSQSRPRTNPFRVDAQHPSPNSSEVQQQRVHEDHTIQQHAYVPPVPPPPPGQLRAHPPPPPVPSNIPEQNPFHAEFLNQSALQQPLPYHDPSETGTIPQELPSSQTRNYSQQNQQPNLTQKTLQDGPQNHGGSAPAANILPNQSHPSSNQVYSQEHSNHQQPGLSHSRQSNHQKSAQDPKDGLHLSSSPLKVKNFPQEGGGAPRVPLHMRPPEKSYLDQFREKQTSSNGQRGGDPVSREGGRSNQDNYDQGNIRTEEISNPGHNVRTLESEKGFQGYGRTSGAQPSGSENNLARNADRKPSGPSGTSRDDSLQSLRFQALPREDSQTKDISKAEKTVKKLPSGEVLHVEYISDDSDDEEMHFVDEMGNPVDDHGNLLSRSSTRTKNLPPKLEYRIKPTPPKQKQSASQRSPSHQGYSQSSATWRTASGHRKLKEGVSQTSQIPSAAGIRRQNTIDKAVGESKAPSPETSPLKSENTQTDVPVIEDIITRTVAEKEGELGGTVPTAKPPSQPLNSQHGESAGGYAPVGDVRLSNIPNQSQPQYGYPANVNPTMQMPLGPYPGVQMPQQFVASQIPGQMVVTNQPAILSPNASYSFAPQMYAQIQPTVAMSPVQTILQPVMQPAPMYMGAQFQQQFMNPQASQPANVNGPSQGQNISTGTPAAFQGTAVTKGEESQESDGTYKNSEDEPEEEDTPPEDEAIINSKQSQRQSKHPKGVRGMLADRNTENKGKNKNRKNQKNFIDANRNNVKNLPPDRKYRERYLKSKAPKDTLNKKQPLPDISQDEDSGEERWAYREGADGYHDEYGEEEWARRLVEDQRMMAALKRHQSESNILDQQNRLYGPVRQRSLPPGYGNDYEVQGEYGNVTFPPGQQPYSYSADRAVTYARMKGAGGGRPRVGFQDDPRVASDGGGRIDARQRFAYTHPMPARYSPFNVLPDIQGRNELRVSDPDGYLMKMHKQRQPPAYKEYTVKDYRALKRDIRLGGLGPDPELIQERQEKAIRQREYAKAISEQNKKALQKTAKPWTPPKEKPPGVETSRRGKALNYARKVPKPALRTPPEELHNRMYGASSKQNDPYDREGAKTYLVDEMANLEELAERHRQEKEEIERLRSGHAP